MTVRVFTLSGRETPRPSLRPKNFAFQIQANETLFIFTGEWVKTQGKSFMSSLYVSSWTCCRNPIFNKRYFCHNCDEDKTFVKHKKRIVEDKWTWYRSEGSDLLTQESIEYFETSLASQDIFNTIIDSRDVYRALCRVLEKSPRPKNALKVKIISEF